MTQKITDADELRAWDEYAAAVLVNSINSAAGSNTAAATASAAKRAAEIADAMLKERRARSK